VSSERARGFFFFFLGVFFLRGVERVELPVIAYYPLRFLVRRQAIFLSRRVESSSAPTLFYPFLSYAPFRISAKVVICVFAPIWVSHENLAICAHIDLIPRRDDLPEVVRAPLRFGRKEFTLIVCPTSYISSETSPLCLKSILMIHPGVGVIFAACPVPTGRLLFE